MAERIEERIDAIKSYLDLAEPINTEIKFTTQECERISKSISRLLADAVYSKIKKSPPDDSQHTDGDFLDALWQSVAKLIKERPNRMLPKLSGLIHEGLVAAEKLSKNAAGTTQKNANVTKPAGDHDRPPPPAPRTQPVTTPPPPPTGSPWKYFPIPNDPDPHSESEAYTFEAPVGYRVFGARVRGKKHKHDGTNCDDWFEVGRCGDWTLIAVSDGAGSKKFSRVGAKAACLASIAHLQSELAAVELPNYNIAQWQDSLNSRREDFTFNDSFLTEVSNVLHQTIAAAYRAMEQACEQRRTPEQEEAYLAVLGGRPLEINDLSATLLLVLHRVVQVESHTLDLVVACQVGDGMSAAIHSKGGIDLIGKADGGAYSGETEFLTSKGKLDPVYLYRKTYAAVNHYQAIMVMTDGVADDYFPNQTQIGRLWGDLLLNRIPDLAIEQTADEALLDLSGCDEMPEIIDRPESRDEIALRTSTKVADKLSVKPEDFVMQFRQLYLAGSTALTDYLKERDSAAERLKLWLDTYTVRGSFDDRTLVVLHRETLP